MKVKTQSQTEARSGEKKLERHESTGSVCDVLPCSLEVSLPLGKGMCQKVSCFSLNCSKQASQAA